MNNNNTTTPSKNSRLSRKSISQRIRIGNSQKKLEIKPIHTGTGASSDEDEIPISPKQMDDHPIENIELSNVLEHVKKAIDIPEQNHSIPQNQIGTIKIPVSSTDIPEVAMIGGTNPSKSATKKTAVSAHRKRGGTASRSTKKPSKNATDDIDNDEDTLPIINEDIGRNFIEEAAVPAQEETEPPKLKLVIDQKVYRTVQNIAHSHATRLVSYMAQALGQDQAKMIEKYVCTEDEIIEIRGTIRKPTEKRPPPIMPERCCARIWAAGKRLRCTKNRCNNHVG